MHAKSLQLYLTVSDPVDHSLPVQEKKRQGFDPWVGKIPWSRKWQPTPVSLLRKFHGQRSLASYSPWSRKESDTTERLTLHYIWMTIIRKLKVNVGENVEKV